MKFQCGKCGKYYIINNVIVANKDLDFQCDNCDDHFYLNRNSVFSSSSKNSNIICGNCGKLIPEQNKVCDLCNLILNTTHEELRIDNKYYELLEINKNGKVYKTHAGKILSKRSVLFPGLLVFMILSVILAWYFTKTNNNKILSKDITRIETQVVIMKPGQTYYADKID